MSTPGELLGALGREARARLGNGRDAQTRTYRGRTVDELVPRIQRDLGADAIIVRRRDGLTGGVLGFFQHAFVEIEAMSGAPGIDVYDEQESAPPPAPAPEAPYATEAATQLPAGAVAPVAPAPAYGSSPSTGGLQPPVTALPPGAAPYGAPVAPGPAAQPVQAPAPGYPSPLDPSAIPGAPAPAPGVRAPAPSAQPPPLGGYRPPSWPAPGPPPAATPTPPEPSPFYSRTPEQDPPGTGSAYVTAHLAALARADRSRLAQREESGYSPPPVRRPQTRSWGSDFQELVAREEPEPFAPALERSPPRAPAERRVVAPGSSARARAGVAKGLQRFGIGEELARELIEGASAHALALAPRSGLAQAVRTTLAQRIPVAAPLPTKGAAIVLVGAGGAGKTTCCAALLSAYRKSSSLPAGCATLTREEERGELRMILAPHVMKPSPARSPRALRALRRARGEGMAVVDTPRVSPSDRANIRELARLLGDFEPERVVVALPATLGARAAAQLLEALAPLGANSLAITHADETDQIGVAVEAACRFGLAPEYMLERGRGGGWRLRHTDPTGLAEKLLQ